MRRRFLDLCLLAYPRVLLGRDREYLRDLALDLAETHGLLRQAWSLLGGGLRARLEVRRQRHSAGLRAWTKRAVVGSFALAFALGITGLIVATEGGAERGHEVEALTCVTDQAESRGCAQARRAVARRARAGWDCTTRRQTHGGELQIASRCTRGGEFVAWRVP
jgi:hypothetical protein